MNNTFKPTVTSSISRASHIIGYNISAEIPPVAKCASGNCKSVAIPRTNKTRTYFANS
jgi:hypothetical protein